MTNIWDTVITGAHLIDSDGNKIIVYNGSAFLVYESLVGTAYTIN